MSTPASQTPQTIAAAWLEQAGRSPERTALIFDDEHWSYADLHRSSCQAAHQLAARGVARGERVILMMDNGPRLLASFFGCQMLGVIAVPVSPKSGVKRLRYLLDDSEAAVVLIEPALSERTRSLHRAQAYGERIVTLEPQPPAATLECVTVDAGDCAFIQYTSGSSGDSKGVMISHRAALENIHGFSAEMALTRSDVFSSLLPLFHDMGLMCFGLAPLLQGYPLVLYRAESLSLYPWLSGIRTHGVTITGAPDSLLQIANRVIDDPAPYDLHSLRMLICGSEPVRRDSIQTFGLRFRILHAIKPAYGMAELTLCATITPVYEPARIDAQGRVASGRRIRGVEVRIAPEQGACSDEMTDCGEILVRSPSAMSGYWRRPAESAAAFDAQGYLRTGDIGYLDGLGYLYVVGRLKNMLIRGGQKFSPHDLEAAAQEIPAIRRAAVVQSDREDASIIAVLEVDRLLLRDPAELQRLARQYRKAAYARAGIPPDSCWFVWGGRIPCTENGKMQHAALRAQIDSGEFFATWSDTSEVNVHVTPVA
jgi:fatty-acyl-CoA synthase